MRASPGLGTYTEHESDVCRRSGVAARTAEDHAPAVRVPPSVLACCRVRGARSKIGKYPLALRAPGRDGYRFRVASYRMRGPTSRER